MLDEAFSLCTRGALKLLEPIGLVWLGLLAITFVLWRRRRRGFAVSTAGLALFVWVIGGTNLPDALLRSLESPYAGVKPEELPAADAVILLGGGLEPSRYETGQLHLSAAGDRVVMALELLRLGKAPALCIGGGATRVNGEIWSEADFARAAIVERKLTTAEVFSLGICGDTHDEALRVFALAQEHRWRRLLLVTSACHMRRAAGTFRTAGLEVIPAPCNFLTSLSTGHSSFPINLPGHAGFAKTSVWIHEQIGWLEYRRRGWIAPGSEVGRPR